MPASLSINLNKVALLRNSRGQGVPDLVSAVDLVLHAGAQGITLHPRLDERHVRFADLPVVADHLRRAWPGVELNIECEDHPEILERALAVRPATVTLVPVTPGEITSDHGWDLPRQGDRLRRAVAWIHGAGGIRVSAFADVRPPGASPRNPSRGSEPDAEVAASMSRFAAAGVDAVELYTGPYAVAVRMGNPQGALDDLFAAAGAAVSVGLRVHAGHDLDAHNLGALRDLPGFAETSIGHAVISRALEVGYPTAVVELLRALDPSRAITAVLR